MQNLNILFKSIVLLFLAINCYGQITIDFPLNNAVYQRGNDNLGSLTISGKFQNTNTTKIEARLKNPTNGLIISGFDWTTIVLNPTLGHYYGTLPNIPGGWYNLEVRNLSGSTVLNSTTLNRVGIGEVFVIAGQSNAEGLDNYGSIDAQSEKVVSHAYNDYQYNIANTDKIPTFPSLSKIVANNHISNKGSSSWAYGKLGDLLTNRLGVPVAFFNSGASGTSSKNWAESSLGQPTFNEYTGLQYANLVGAPYIHFRNTLKYYANNFGVRGVLWHQGETDKDKGVTSAEYLSRLSTVISKSREHFNQDLSWAISRASYGSGVTSSHVIGGQNQTVQQNTTKNFYGPETDLIQPRKNDSNDGNDVHFEGPRLIDLANEWDFALNSSYFSNSTPITPSTLKPLAISCGNNNYTLTAPSGFSQYKWIRVDNGGNYNFEQTGEATTQSITKTTGTYFCYLINNDGHISISQLIDVANVANFCSLPLPLCDASDFLSDLPFLGTPYNQNDEFGPIRKDKSHSNNNIILNGVTYSKGLGVHAQSEVQYSLTGKNYINFKADIGLDDYITDPNCGNVVFKVFGDNNLLYASVAMTATSPTISIDIPVSGYSILKLVVDINGVFYCDHADWADAKLYFQSNTQPQIVADKSILNIGQSATLTMPSCVSPSYVKWSDNIIANPYTINPINTQVYSAVCITSTCQSLTSNQLTLSVLPDCANSYTLTSPVNDISVNDLSYKVMNSISASNKITNAKKVTYDAKNSIILSPGFLAENGTIFTAKVEGCNN